MPISPVNAYAITTRPAVDLITHLIGALLLAPRSALPKFPFATPHKLPAERVRPVPRTEVNEIHLVLQFSANNKSLIIFSRQALFADEDGAFFEKRFERDQASATPYW